MCRLWLTTDNLGCIVARVSTDNLGVHCCKGVWLQSMCRLWLTTDNLGCIVARVSGCKVCAGCG